MNVQDLNNFYLNRQLLDKMQRTSGAEKHGARSVKSPASATETVKAQNIKPQQIDKKSPLYQACQDFEAIFIKQMLDTMRKTVEKSGLIDGGMAEDVFEDMLYDQYAKKMAENAQFGLSETLYKQLSAKAR